MAEFAKGTPIQRLHCNGRPWQGLLTMQPLIEELHGLLPKTFAELKQGALLGLGV